MLTYITPFALYLIFSQLLAKAPQNLYPLLYSGVVLLTGLTTFYLLRKKNIIPIHTNIWAGVLFGVIGIIAWILICGLQLEQSLAEFLPGWLQPEDRVAFNPFVAINDPLQQWGFIGVRLLGLAVLVPVIEEIFWRGFLMRWIIDPDWENQALGRFTLSSFLWITLLFTLAHPEWFAAAVYCMLINGLMYWKKDLWNCVVAHATSNLLLGAYVLYAGAWELW
ncbi:MAG: CAAX prenyl protease-like protein [Desulforhopalus sp.]|jgi:CAAX prenyl protease-like protein